MNQQQIKLRIKKFFIEEKPNILFLHIPKTGGTSVNFAFKKLYQKSYYEIDPAMTNKTVKFIQSIENVSKLQYDKFKLRKHLALHEMFKGTKFISGHILFDKESWERYHQEYSYLTVLREPVSRYISNYFFDAFKKDEHARISVDLPTFIYSDRGRRKGHFYIDYIGGFSKYDNVDLETKIEIAKGNLDKFKFVGFLDKFDKLTADINNQLGLKINIYHKNKNPISKPKVESGIVDEIRKLCQPDIEFYEYARSKFLK